MRLFGKSKNEKKKELRDKFLSIGVNVLASTDFSLEERIKLIKDVEKSIDENFDNARDVKKELIQKACDEIATDYPAFSDRAGWIKDSAIEGIDEDGFIYADGFDVLMSVIRWEFMTPEEAENLLKNIRAEKKVLSSDDYKKIMEKISQKFEKELLLELNSVAKEDVVFWIDDTKKKKKALSNKVYAKAMAIKKGEPWLSDDDFEKNNSKTM